MNQEELKPCPFCGGEAKEIRKYYQKNNYFESTVTCVRCKIRTITYLDKIGSLDNQAIRNWNRRGGE